VEPPLSGFGTSSVWPTLNEFGSVMPLIRASSSAVVPNCVAIDESESPGWTVYSSKGDASGVGLGAGEDVAAGEAPGVGEAPRVGEAPGVRAGVALGRAVAVAVDVRVTDGWPASAPDSSSPGGRISSHNARTEATRRASSAPRNTAPEGMALDGS
jgi:hypothetical protein